MALFSFLRVNMSIAKLVPVMLERCYRSRSWFTNRLSPRFYWVEGYKVITPDQKEIQPYMLKLEARRYCREMGWDCVVQTKE